MTTPYRPSSSTPCLINSQTLKMISQVESFLCPDKQETPEQGRRIQRLKRCASTNGNKDEDNRLKITTKIIVIKTHLKSSNG